MGHRTAVACIVLAVVLSGTAGALAFDVRHEYYVYATSGDGVPLMEEVILTGQTHTEGACTHTGSYGNYGHAEFSADLAAARVTAFAHAHGVKVATYTFGVATGRVETASFADELTFTVPAGFHPEGVTVSLAGRAGGSITSTVGAGAQAGVHASLGTAVHQTGLLTVGIDDSGTIVVDEPFTLAHQLVAPGTTLAHATDYTVAATLRLHRGWTWSVEYNTGSGYVTGDGTIDFRDGLRFTSLTLPPGVTCTSASGVFIAAVSAVPTTGPQGRAARLLGNAPNPFNPATTVTYALAQAGPVRVRIHALSGALVRTLAAGEWREAGIHAVPWDGRDASGRPVAAGVYVCRLEAGAQADARTMVLLK